MSTDHGTRRRSLTELREDARQLFVVHWPAARAWLVWLWTGAKDHNEAVARWIMVGIAVLAVWAGWQQLSHLAEKTRRLEDSIRQNTITTTYAQGNQLTRLVADYPGIRRYFDADGKPCVPFHEPAANPLSSEQADLRDRVWAACVMHADFFEQVWLLQKQLPKQDWQQWFQFFCDAYDESDVLRNYFKTRGRWYTMGRILADPAKRELARSRLPIPGLEG